MRNILSGLLAGILFGGGLALSDMTNPARVLAFLDLAGSWDPTLAFVMGGALLPSALGYLIVRHMRRPLIAEAFCIPRNKTVDTPMIAGAAIFGTGWGLVGLCPGPGIAALGLGLWQPWLFVVAMLAGMALHRIVAAARPPADIVPLPLESGEGS